MANRYSELQQVVADMEDDFRKFYDKGNKAAGTRIRKGMQDLKKMAQDIRAEAQALKGLGGRTARAAGGLAGDDPTSED